MNRLKEMDPEGKFNNSEYRRELFLSASPQELFTVIATINQILTESDQLNISHKQTVLESGKGDDRLVSFVGLAPEMRREFFIKP